MKVIDRNFREYKVSPPLVKDSINIGTLMPKVAGALMMTHLLEDKGIFYGNNRVYTLDEQYTALVELLTLVIGSEDIGAFDISMASKAILHAFSLDRPTMPPLKDLVVLDRLGVLDKIISENRGVVTMEKEITTGTPIVDRDGNKYTAYSYLVTEFSEAMELLEKIDTFNMLENNDEESFDAMLEIVYRSLNKKYPKEELVTFVDAEFAQKAIRCYFNLQQI